MSIATDVRAYADAALEQGKTALAQATTFNKRIVEDAPKPAFAAVGVADLVAETVAKRVEALPAEAAETVAKAQELSKVRFAKVQEEALATIAVLRERFDARVETVKAVPTLPSAAKDAAEGYVATAKNLYESLTARGEAKVAELRKDPRLVKFLGEVSDAADSVQAKVAPIVDTVQAQVENAVETVKAANPVSKPAAKPAARTAPAKKAPAAKATATKAPAKKAPAKATPSA
jgi:heparin binding hemagglutinin HbhA